MASPTSALRSSDSWSAPRVSRLGQSQPRQTASLCLPRPTQVFGNASHPDRGWRQAAQAAPRARPRRSRLEFRPSRRLGKLRRLARAQASDPTHEVRRLGGTTVDCEVVGVSLLTHTTFDSMVTVRRRTDANGNSPYSSFERNRARRWICFQQTGT